MQRTAEQPLAVYQRLSSSVFFLITQMLVTTQRCTLYVVVRTDTSTSPWEQRVLTYAPRDYLSAVKLAAKYQREFDPNHTRYDYRVGLAS